MLVIVSLPEGNPKSTTKSDLRSVWWSNVGRHFRSFWQWFRAAAKNGQNIKQGLWSSPHLKQVLLQTPQVQGGVNRSFAPLWLEFNTYDVTLNGTPKNHGHVNNVNPYQCRMTILFYLKINVLALPPVGSPLSGAAWKTHPADDRPLRRGTLRGAL